MMKSFTFHQVLGSRLEVIVATDQLVPKTYNLATQVTERSA